jgi:hypothetical protein
MARAVLIAVAMIALAAPGRAQATGATPTLLDEGYRALYNLQFEDAHKAFAQWRRLHPADAMGPASDAAAYLFSEFNRLHVLELQFFVNDRNFDRQKELVPDAQARQAFEKDLAAAQQAADAALARDAHEPDARFANVLVLALRGDYLALIEKRNLAGLSYIQQARTQAERLLAEHPSYYDAYLARGVENYLLGVKPAPVRWVLHLRGAQTDKQAGIHNLRITAEKGHYLRPYARLLLAVAALRDGDSAQARALLEDLAREFPHNPLYSRELAQLH